MATSNRREELKDAINQETRRIRVQTLNLVFAACVILLIMTMLVNVPCVVYATDDLLDCAANTARGIFLADLDVTRQLIGTTGTLFVTLVVALVIIRPIAELEAAANEAVRGALVMVTRSLGLVAAGSSVYWLVSSLTWIVSDMYGNSSTEDQGHPLDVILGFLAILFFSCTSSVLRTGLSTLVQNIEWATAKLDVIDYWDKFKRPAQAVRASRSFAASILLLTLVLHSVQHLIGATAATESAQMAWPIFGAVTILWWLISTLMCAELKGTQFAALSVIPWVVGPVFALYMVAPLTYVLPPWAAVALASTVALTVYSAVSATCFARFHVPSRWYFALSSTIARDRRRYRRIIEENTRLLAQAGSSSTVKTDSSS